MLKDLVARAGLLCLRAGGAVAGARDFPVLLYHSIDESGSPVSITRDRFRAHLGWIAQRGYRTISATELVDVWSNGSFAALPERSVVLTFDDGLETVESGALPLLEEFGFTCTVFLATGYVGGKCTWKKDSRIPDFPLLSWSKIREMDRKGVDFQSHTASHPFLTGMSRDAVGDELRRSRDAIEQTLGRRCDVLSYPYTAFDENTVEVLREQGYRAAFAGMDAPPNQLGAIRRVGSGHLVRKEAFLLALEGRFTPYYRLKGVLPRSRRHSAAKACSEVRSCDQHTA